MSSTCIFACLAYGLSNRRVSALEQNTGWTNEQQSERIGIQHAGWTCEQQSGRVGRFTRRYASMCIRAIGFRV